MGRLEGELWTKLMWRLLHERTPLEKHAAGLVGAVDAGSGAPRYASAGQNPGPLVRSYGTTEWLHPTGMPLGLMPVAEYASAEIMLAAGDTGVYSDGITEMNYPDDGESGEQRLRAARVANRHLPPRELAAALDRELEAFAKGAPFADDRTMVILRKVG